MDRNQVRLDCMGAFEAVNRRLRRGEFLPPREFRAGVAELLSVFLPLWAAAATRGSSFLWIASECDCRGHVRLKETV